MNSHSLDPALVRSHAPKTSPALLVHLDFIKRRITDAQGMGAFDMPLRDASRLGSRNGSIAAGSMSFPFHWEHSNQMSDPLKRMAGK